MRDTWILARALVPAAGLAMWLSAGCDAAHTPSDDASSSDDAGHDAPSDAFAPSMCDASTPLGVGTPCTTSADCTGLYDLCSYLCDGCSTEGVCIGRRMCFSQATFCGCDGTTFTTEVCFDGIPSPWVHVGPC
jgi:hypothetical protein